MYFMLNTLLTWPEKQHYFFLMFFFISLFIALLSGKMKTVISVTECVKAKFQKPRLVLQAYRRYKLTN